MSAPVDILFTWVLPLLRPALYLIILACCIFGACRQGFRLPFIFLALGALIALASAIIFVIPTFLQTTSSSSYSVSNMQNLMKLGGIIGTIGQVTNVLGFILLATRVWTVRIVQQ